MLSLAEELRRFLPTIYKKYGPLNARQYAYQAFWRKIVDSKKKFKYVGPAMLATLR